MGSGLYRQQLEGRFYLGQEVESEPPTECVEATAERWQIGDYSILRDEEGYHVSKGDEAIGDFAEGEVLEGENKALFSLDKGMLLKVTPEGHRQIFSREKASLHGAASADGTLYCGGYWEKYRGKWGWHYKYIIKLSERDPAVRTVFAKNFEKVYGLKAHDYPKRREIFGYGKEMAYDLSKYGPINTYDWHVPFEHLDKEGARYWLRGYFTGDGSSYVGRYPRKDEVTACSVNKRGLEEVRSLLDNYFGIKCSVYRSRNKTTESESDVYTLRISRMDLDKFRDEIGFDSPEKQRKLDYMVTRLRKK